MPSRFRAVVSAALLTAAAVGVGAQPADAPRPAASAASAASAADAPSPAYRSAFDGYRSFNEQPVRSWREANDVVGRIGGWQAYAREGQGGPVAGSASAAQGTASAGGASAPAVRGHSMADMPGMGAKAAPPPGSRASTAVPARPGRAASGAMSGHKMP